MRPPARVSAVDVDVDVESDATDAGDEELFPFGSYPCAHCQAVVAGGMLFCVRCKAPQTDDLQAFV